MAGCAPAGQPYRLAPLEGQAVPPAPFHAQTLIFPGGTTVASNPEFVYAESPVGGVYYGAWSGCGIRRDELFYEGFRRGLALELQPLGSYPDVKPYCRFGLASDGDNILVFGGTTRESESMFRPRLHSQVLVLDPEHGTARRLSPPRGFRRRLSRVFFDARLGSYILEDHRETKYRFRLP